eukprot:2919654-Rhodomonas_salina.1
MVQVDEQEPVQSAVLRGSGEPAEIREECIVSGPILESHPPTMVPGSGRAVSAPESRESARPVFSLQLL